jgi:hypothetical protein
MQSFVNMEEEEQELLDLELTVKLVRDINK